jgi:hypothetical protein
MVCRTRGVPGGGVCGGSAVVKLSALSLLLCTATPFQTKVSSMYRHCQQYNGLGMHDAARVWGVILSDPGLSGLYTAYGPNVWEQRNQTTQVTFELLCETKFLSPASATQIGSQVLYRRATQPWQQRC